MRLLKLKNKLTLFNALSKALIVLLLLLMIPWLVDRVTLRETDYMLLDKFDEVIYVVDSLGIEMFIDQEAEFKAFGSYNILKEEFISIEEFYEDTLYTVIETSPRMIEDEVLEYRVLSGTIGIGEDYYLIEIGRSIETILNFERNIRNFALLSLFIILFVTAIIDQAFIQLLLKPFKNIIEKLRTTDHPNKFNFSEIKTSTSDFKYLQDTIHNLMHRIENAFNSEREYIGNVSHELLTPISIIQTKLDNIINEGNLSDTDLGKVFDSKKTLSRLTQMVRTLLIMSRIENEEYLLNENVDIIKVILEVAEEIEDRISMKELCFDYSPDTNNYRFTGNSNLLFNLFFNLINNAIKYTPQGGSIEVRTEFYNNQLTVIIKDTGEGISIEDLPNIFSRFKKFNAGNEGFGLGLALVKKICDYHRISIDVESEVGKGSIFKLFFEK